MGYLICNDCKGFYELQLGENQEDFEKCQCGGILQYQEQLEYETETLESETLQDEGNFEASNAFYPENGINFSTKLNSMPKTLIMCILAIVAILLKLYFI